MTERAPTRGWTGHVIVCGLRGVALRTVEYLHRSEVPVVVVDDAPDQRAVAAVQALGIPYLRQRRPMDDPLAEAGLAGALAVVCAEDSDLVTLETALLVRTLRSDVRVVVHLDNPAVGRAVQDLKGAGSVLDVAGLFAPAVVNACLGLDTHELEIAGQRFVVAGVDSTASGTLRELYGDLVPLGIARGEAGLDVCPSRDARTAPGDHVSLLGTPQALAAAGIAIAQADDRPASLARRMRRRAGAALRDAADMADRSIRTTLLVSLAIALVSTAVLAVFYDEDGERMSVLEAFYFTIETAATVGFGDFSFRDQTPALQVFAVGLIVAGTMLVSLLFAFITNALVSRRIEQSLGRAPIRGVEGHTVLVGLGAVGMRVLEGLVERGCEVVVIERDEDNRYASQARLLGVRVIVGDATLTRTLEAAAIRDAAAVAIVTSDDLTNIETALSVRDALGPRFETVPVVLRVFDRSLGRRLESGFGFAHVWSTAAIAAPWFVGAAIGLDVLSTFYVANRPFLVARMAVRPGGGLDGVAMDELAARIRVVAIERTGVLEQTPRRDTRFAAGDIAYVAGPYQELLAVLRRGR